MCCHRRCSFLGVLNASKMQPTDALFSQRGASESGRKSAWGIGGVE